MNTQEALHAVLAGERLERDAMRNVLGEVFAGDADPVCFGGLLVALAARGETREELIGAAQAMRAVMVPFEHDAPDAIDTCGTGGSGLDTFNISTAAALVAAAAGARVIKHGNRSASSKSGSADLLEALGLPLDLTPQAAREVFESVGITFLFAPTYHPAMRHAGPIRRALGVRTLFNLLGPLCSPAGIRRQVLGVFDARRVGDLAHVLDALGTERALVVHGAEGADELTLNAENLVQAVGPVDDGGLDAASLGLRTAALETCSGGDARANAAMLRALLDGDDVPARDFVLINACAALLVADCAKTASKALDLALEALACGAAKAKLDAWVAAAQAAAGDAR